MKGAWQLRAELELPDAPTIADLPKGWRWSEVCFWVVNSDGVANDPQRRLVKRGGQLHTPAFRCPADLAAACGPLLRQLRPRVNYRAAMRIQVHVPGLACDLSSLQRLCEYTRCQLPPLWPRLDPLDRLLDLQPDERAAKAAHARLTATIRARHFLISSRRHQARMNASTVSRFIACEKVVKPNGRPAYTMPTRESVDVRDIVLGEWVTLRCFAQARDPLQVEAAAGFAQGWLIAALQGHPAQRVIERWEHALPRQMPFVHRLEQGWEHTNFHHQSRRVVEHRLAQAGITR